MKKTLILMRHGQAGFAATSDAQRPLTSEGEEQARRTGQMLKQAGFTPQLILCSPLLRAQQSAQLAASAWEIAPQTEGSLDGRLSAAGLVDLAQEYLAEYDCILLVGHNPNVSLAAGLLNGQYVSFRPGNAMVFDVTDFNKPIVIFKEIT